MLYSVPRPAHSTPGIYPVPECGCGHGPNFCKLMLPERVLHASLQAEIKARITLVGWRYLPGDQDPRKAPHAPSMHMPRNNAPHGSIARSLLLAAQGP